MDLVPDRIWLKLIRGRWAVLASRDPADALRFMMQAQEELNRYIDQGAIRYENGIHVKHRLTRYHDFFVERIRPGERVLDVGCGNGAVSYDVAWIWTKKTLLTHGSGLLTPASLTSWAMFCKTCPKSLLIR
jgi:SAM-dependent methyltransferase